MGRRMKGNWCARRRGGKGEKTTPFACEVEIVYVQTSDASNQNRDMLEKNTSSSVGTKRTENIQEMSIYPELQIRTPL